MSTRQDSHHSDRDSALLQTVHEISRETSIHLASDPVLQSACQRLADALAVDYVLAVRSGDQTPPEGAIIAEYPARLGRDVPIMLDGLRAYQQLLVERKPVVIDMSASDSSESGPARFQSLDLKTVVLVPLLVLDDLIGFLMVGTAQPDRLFAENEQRALQTVAAQLAISLRNTELVAEIQRRANQLDQLTAFGRLVTSTLDRSRILQHVIEIVPSLLPADQLSVALLTAGQSRMLVVTLGRGAPPQEDEMAAAGSGVEEVVQTQNPILIPDLRSSMYTDHARMREQGLRSIVIAPLTVGGRTFGAVAAGHRRMRMYTPTDLTLLQQIGSQIAIALENARRFQSTHQRAQHDESLSEIVSHLQQQADLRVMLQQTMQDLGQVLGARRARVRLQVTPSEESSGAKPNE
jgi:GAF domain-containing protein